MKVWKKALIFTASILATAVITGCFASGDASINAACKNGGITKVSWVSYSVNNFLGTYATYTTTVYGD